jgi:hypothetical protein
MRSALVQCGCGGAVLRVKCSRHYLRKFVACPKLTFATCKVTHTVVNENSLMENEQQMHINSMMTRDAEEIIYAVRFEPDCMPIIIIENMCSYIKISQHLNEV